MAVPHGRSTWSLDSMERSFRLFALLPALLVPAVALACSCPEPRDVDAEFWAARAVMLVEVLSSDRIPADGARTPPRQFDVERARVRVLVAWKGPIRPGDIVILESPQTGTCGRNTTNDPPWALTDDEADTGARQLDTRRRAALPKTWLVYGYGDQPWALTGCSRSDPADWVPLDIEALDRLAPRKTQRKPIRN
jgi:hypothetical protein